MTNQHQLLLLTALFLAAVAQGSFIGNANINVTSLVSRFFVFPSTLTSTSSITTTTTVTVVTKTSCASLLNVAAACRRKRYAPFLMFAEGSDGEENSAAAENKIQASVPQPVEVTEAPHYNMMPASQESSTPSHIEAVSSPCVNKKPNDELEEINMTTDDMDKTTESRSVMVEPSMESTPGLAEVRIENLDQVCSQKQQARVADPFFGQLFKITVLYSTTITATSTVTSTSTSFSTTNTFVISSCTPSPFPYTICTASG